ncbi:MAG: transposase domain-containing protein [Paracoccaceae bacterium]
MEWWGVTDLVELGHPDLPVTASGLRRYADRRGWHGDGAAPLVKVEPGPDGADRRLYHLNLLPETVRRYIALSASVDVARARRSADARATVKRRQALWQRFDRAPDAHKATARERLDAVQAMARIMPPHSVRGAALVVGATFDLAESTLVRWWDLVAGADRSDWLAALVPDYTVGRPKAPIDPRVLDCFKAHWLRAEAVSMAHAHEEVVKTAHAQGWGKVPSAKTLRARVIDEVGHEGITAARQGKKALADLYPHQERSTAHLRAMDAANADGHVVDVFVEWEDGSIGRPIILGFQDLYSNLILSCRVGKTETAELIRLAIGDMIECYSIPQKVYFDNGRAFASKAITGRASDHRFRGKIRSEDPQGVLAMLGCEVHFVKPYHGQSKPIERAWREFAARLAKHIAFAGAYVGNKPDAKPENYGSHAVPIAQFREVLAQYVIEHNQRNGRRGRDMNGRSFADVFAESWAQEDHLIRRPTREQIAFCQLAGFDKAVQRRRGEVAFGGHRFWAEELIAYRGRKVSIRFDPDALVDGVRVYDNHGRFIVHAACIEAQEFDDPEAAKRHAASVAAFTRTTLANLRRAISRMPAAEAAELLAEVERKALPERTVLAVSHAGTGTDGLPPPSATDIHEAAFSRAVAGLGAKAPNVHDFTPATKKGGG